MTTFINFPFFTIVLKISFSSSLPPASIIAVVVVVVVIVVCKCRRCYTIDIPQERLIILFLAFIESIMPAKWAFNMMRIIKK